MCEGATNFELFVHFRKNLLCYLFVIENFFHLVHAAQHLRVLTQSYFTLEHVSLASRT